MRIISLLPAATDIVSMLDLGDRLVGRTHECDWPPALVRDVPVVTRSDLDGNAASREIAVAVSSGSGPGSGHRGSAVFELRQELIEELAPDLILTQDLCDVCAISYEQVTRSVARLPGPGPQVVSMSPRTVNEVFDTVRAVAAIGGVPHRGRALEVDLRRRLDALRDATAGLPRPRTAFIEWLDPLMPGGHWVPEQIAAGGGRPVLTEPGAHSAVISWDDVREAGPEALVVGPCGLGIERTRTELSLLTGAPGWSELPAVRSGRVWSVDGPAYFNRPGPRVVRGAEILAALLHGVGDLQAGESEAVPPD